MNRRTFLRAAGATALATVGAGCTALVGASNCRPADDPLGSIDAARPVDNGGEEYRFRGTVVRYLDEGVLVDDATGKAQLLPGASKHRINHDLVKVGHCLEGRGSLNRERTRAHGMAVLTVGRADFEDVGDSAADVEPVGDYPTPEFGVGDASGGVAVTVTDGAGAAADNVFVAYGSESHPWPELDDDTASGDSLREGARAVVRNPSGEWVTLQWRSPDRTWGHRVGMVRASG